MPLTSDQLSALQAPKGWILTRRPTLRASGRIDADISPDQSWDSRCSAVTALRKWATENELGLKSSNVVGSIWARRKTPNTFSVHANQPDLTKWLLGPGDCYCGRRVDHSVSACEYCGPATCISCSVIGLRMFYTNNDLYCFNCTVKCGHKGCKARTITGWCDKHDPNILCAVCDLRVDSTGSKELAPPWRDKQRACARCVKRMTCEGCKKFRNDELLNNSKLCTECLDKKDEEERTPHETWSADELPQGGKLVVPSLPSRPFRTISIETEMDGDGPYLARVLHKCGHVPFPRVGEYRQHPDESEDYLAFLKHDGSVTAGELIAFLIDLDNEQHADNLMDLMSKLRSLNKIGKIAFNSNCGGHIHVDAHNYGYGNIWRLLTGFGYCEDVIYRIAGAGSTYGHRTLDPRHDAANGHRGYAKSPIKGPFGSKGAVGGQVAAQDRMCGLNFQPLLQAIRHCACGAWAYEDSRKCTCNLGNATIEWRVFNSTYNPRILHAWIALIQAFHSWADEIDDPTPEWEKEFPALTWTKRKFEATTAEHQHQAKGRLEWIHTYLPLTEKERDSINYAITKSDMGPILGKEFIKSLTTLPNVADFEKPKVVRNPAKRKRDIVISKRDNQNENELFRPLEYVVDIAAQGQNAVFNRQVVGAPLRRL